LDPETTSVKFWLPAVMVEGERATIVGTGLLMLKFTEADAGFTPQKPEFVTLIAATPPNAMSAAGIQAPSWLPLMNAVAKGPPLKHAMELETKFEPLMRSSKSGPPVSAVEGESEEILGVGFAGPVIVNETDGDSMMPETVSRTATLAMPADATSALVICAVSLIEEMKVVVRNWPFQVTTSFAVKFEPFTVRMKAEAPEAALAGEIVDIAGAPIWSGSIVNDTALETPPPGAGFATVIWTTFGFTTKDAGTEACNWAVVVLKKVESGMPFQKANDAPVESD